MKNDAFYKARELIKKNPTADIEKEAFNRFVTGGKVIGLNLEIPNKMERTAGIMIQKPLKRLNDAKRGLTDKQVYHLIKGHYFYDENIFKNEVEREEAYFKYEKYIFSLLGTQMNSFRPFLPFGERPEGWWRYRWPVLGLRPRVQIDGPKMEPIGDEMRFGKYLFYKEFLPGVKWESQFSYLKFFNLLLPGEERKYVKQEVKKFKLKLKLQNTKISDIDDLLNNILV